MGVGPDDTLTEERLSPGRALVVVNPAAGSASPAIVRAALDEVLGPSGWHWDVYSMASASGLAQAIGDAREIGCDLVIAAGGDGTVACVADSLIGCGIPLAVVPLGTGNVLSMALGIPEDTRQALRLIVGPHQIRELDAMRVRESHFVLQIGIGLDSLMIRDTEPAEKRRLGRLAYLRTLTANVVGYQAKRFRVVVDGRRRRFHAWQVLVANVGTLGSPLLRWAPDIKPDDGKLDLMVANVREPLDYVRLAWRFLRGRSGADPSLRHYRIRRRVEIDSRPKLPVQADGEIVGQTPVQIEIVPRAVRVVVPEREEDRAPLPRASEPQVRRAARARRRLSRWLGPVGLLDTQVFIWVSQLPHTWAVDEAMKLLALVMNRADAVAAAVVVDGLLGGAAGWRATAEVVPALELTNLTVEYPIKRLFARARPFESAVAARVIGKKPRGYSFPSGHSAAAFAAAYLGSRCFPRLRVPLYALAGTMAFSRMYLRVHYLSDVVVGAATGTALAAGYGWAIRAALRAALGARAK